MKTFLLILGIAGAALMLTAQTNSPGAAAPGTAENAPLGALQTNAIPHERLGTEIFSDSATFDLKSNIVVYIGNVRVLDPQMALTCDVLTAHVPQAGKIDSIVAEHHVVIDAVEKGKTVHATCETALYTYGVANFVTNETIELTGDPYIQREGGSRMNGEKITWDRANDRISVAKPRMLLVPDAKESTNSAPAGAAEKN